MDLYRIKPGDGVVWITGASAGIGRQLALQMVKEGYSVVGSARNADALAELGEEVADAKGRYFSVPGDVTNKEDMQATVAKIEQDFGQIRLAVFNAGNYWPTPGEAMDIEAYRKNYEVNLFGVLNGLVPVVERMKGHGKGQIALVASVSGYTGLPAASAYGSCKAALNNMAESLKFDFDKMNIRIQIVNPGFIDTPLTGKNEYDMPFLMPVDKAVDRMVRGFEHGGFEITFPRRFTYILKVLRLMPHSVYFWLMRRATGWKTRKLDYRDTTPAKIER